MNYLFLELYKVGDLLHGQFIDNTLFNILKQDYGRTFKLPGQKVCQYFVVSDHTIKVDDIKDFIQRIEKGRVVYRHIDLSSISNPRVNKK